MEIEWKLDENECLFDVNCAFLVCFCGTFCSFSALFLVIFIFLPPFPLLFHPFLPPFLPLGEGSSGDNTELRTALEPVLKSRGAQLMYVSLDGLFSKFNRKSCNRVLDMILQIITLQPREATECMRAFVATLPATVTNEEKEAFLRGVAAEATRSPRAMESVLMEFARLVRKRLSND